MDQLNITYEAVLITLQENVLDIIWDKCDTLFFVVFIVSYVWYYFTRVVSKVSFHCGEGTLREKLLKNVSNELNEKIYPLFWCFAPLAQSVLYIVCGKVIDIPFFSEEINTPDGGAFTLDFYGFEERGTTSCDEAKPIVVLIPGATGHSGKVYVREFISCSLQAKFRAIGFNFRGIGNHAKLKNARLNCVTKGDDLKQMFELIHVRWPHTPVLVVAFSIGACTFINYLIRKGGHPNILSACILGTPWDPVEAKRQLSKFWNNLVINKHMTNQLIDIIDRNKAVVKRDIQDIPSIDLNKIYKCQSVWDFDDHYICPLNGYTNHKEFYEDASLKLLPLETISIPILCICSQDDPLCSGDEIPLQKILKNPMLAVVITKYGGHLAWLEGLYLTQNRFIHRLFIKYAKMFVEENKFK